MGWKARPSWVQIVLALVLLALWFLAVFTEIPFLINVWFGVLGAVALLIVCNRSRRWGVIVVGIAYLIWVFAAYRSGMNCYALAREGSLCGLWVAVPVFGWALLPVGALVGGVIAWVVGKIKERKEV